MCTKHKTKEIFVSPIPESLFRKLIMNQCTKPNQCYVNCTLAVLNYGLADTYTLCFLEDPDDNLLGHALIKVNGIYYDPTLYGKGLYVKRYWLHTEMDKLELIDFIKDFNSINTASISKIDSYPPALFNDGTIACVDPELA
jgi:hypothetical protein